MSEARLYIFIYFIFLLLQTVVRQLCSDKLRGLQSKRWWRGLHVAYVRGLPKKIYEIRVRFATVLATGKPPPSQFLFALLYFAYVIPTQRSFVEIRARNYIEGSSLILFFLCSPFFPIRNITFYLFCLRYTVCLHNIYAEIFYWNLCSKLRWVARRGFCMPLVLLHWRSSALRVR